MDAPLITRDPSAHITDVYAFISKVGNVKYLTAAVAVYPFEEPSIGPNKYNFDDNVLYAIHIATGADLAEVKPTISYLFKFNTTFKNNNTIEQSFLGPIENVNDANQNLTQRYSVTKVVHKGETVDVLGTDLLVPPNNQGLVTPHYNQNENGNNFAKEGVNDLSQLDVYTSQTVHPISKGYIVFAGQRSDGFYANIQSIFDLDATFPARKGRWTARLGLMFTQSSSIFPYLSWVVTNKLSVCMPQPAGKLLRFYVNPELLRPLVNTSRSIVRGILRFASFWLPAKIKIFSRKLLRPSIGLSSQIMFWLPS